MNDVLTTIQSVDQPPGAFLTSIGSIFTTFGADTRDSGNVSYGVEIGGRRRFVKTTDPGAAVLLDYDERVELLRNAVRIAGSCGHPALPRMLNVVESPHGPMLIYEWADGRLLRDESARRQFRRLPEPEIMAVLDRIYELHAELADSGWVAVDFYDGCLIYDFSCRTLRIVDLDGYHREPFRNSMGRMFGSSRFMAPEEFNYGHTIDQRTTVFTMGRTAAVLFADGRLDPEAFRGCRACFEVLVRACRPLPQDRFESVQQFYDAWQRAR